MATVLERDYVADAVEHLLGSTAAEQAERIIDANWSACAGCGNALDPTIRRWAIRGLIEDIQDRQELARERARRGDRSGATENPAAPVRSSRYVIRQYSDVTYSVQGFVAPLLDMSAGELRELAARLRHQAAGKIATAAVAEKLAAACEEHSVRCPRKLPAGVLAAVLEEWA